MIQVTGQRELAAVVLALKVVDRELAKDIRQATVRTIGPVWKNEVASHARTTQDRAVLVRGAAVRGGNPPVAVAGGSARRMRGGARPNELASPLEFGVKNRQARTRYLTHSRKGKAYPVTRRTQRQLPPRFPGGRVVFPAFKEVAPRATSLWVQLVVRKVYDAFSD